MVEQLMAEIREEIERLRRSKRRYGSVVSKAVFSGEIRGLQWVLERLRQLSHESATPGVRVTGQGDETE